MANNNQNSSRNISKLSAEFEENGLESDWPPPWIVTYGDMCTLLMTFFILWYALTLRDIPAELLTIQPIRILTKSKIEVFQELKEVTHEEQKIITHKVPLTPKAELDISQAKQMNDIKEDIQKYLRDAEMESSVKVKIIGENVVIIPEAKVLFSSGKTNILKTEPVKKLLQKITKIALQTNMNIRVEGHSDDTPIHPKKRHLYPDNWSLSIARAGSVVQEFISEFRFPAERLAVSGYGPARPVVPNDSDTNRSRNRRVEFHLFKRSSTI